MLPIENREVLTPWRKSKWGGMQRLSIKVDEQKGVTVRIMKQNVFEHLQASLAQIFNKTSANDQSVGIVEEKKFEHISKENFLKHQAHLQSLCNPLDKKIKQIKQEVEAELNKMEVEGLLAEKNRPSEKEAPPHSSQLLSEPVPLYEETLVKKPFSEIESVGKAHVTESYPTQEDQINEQFAALNKEIGALNETVALLMGKVTELQPSLPSQEAHQRRTSIVALQQQLQQLLIEVADEQKKIDQEGRYGLFKLIENVKLAAAEAIENLVQISKEMENPRFKTKLFSAKLDTIKQAREQLHRHLTDLRQVKTEGSFVLQKIEKISIVLRDFPMHIQEKYQAQLSHLEEQIKVASTLQELHTHQSELDGLFSSAQEQYRSQILSALNAAKNVLAIEIKKLPVHFVDKQRQAAVYGLKQQVYEKRKKIWEALERHDKALDAQLGELVKWDTIVKREALTDLQLIAVLQHPLKESMLEGPKSWLTTLYNTFFRVSNNPFDLAQETERALSDYMHLFLRGTLESSISILEKIESTDKFVLLQRFKNVLKEQDTSLEKLQLLISDLNHFLLIYVEARPEEGAQLDTELDTVFDLKFGVDLLLQCQKENHERLIEVVEARRKTLCTQAPHPSFLRHINRLNSLWKREEPSYPNLFQLELGKDDWWQAGMYYLEQLASFEPIALVQNSYFQLKKQLEEKLSAHPSEGLSGGERKHAQKLYKDLCYQLDLDLPVQQILVNLADEVTDPTHPFYLAVYKKRLTQFELLAKTLFAREGVKQSLKKRIEEKINLQVEACKLTIQQLSGLEQKLSSLLQQRVDFSALRAQVNQKIEKLEPLKFKGTLPKRFFTYLPFVHSDSRPVSVENLSLPELQQYASWTDSESEKVRLDLKNQFNMAKINRELDAIALLEKRQASLIQGYEDPDTVQLLHIRNLNIWMMGIKQQLSQSLLKSNVSIRNIEYDVLQTKLKMQQAIKTYEKLKSIHLLKQIEHFANVPQEQLKLIFHFLTHMSSKVEQLAEKLKSGAAEFQQNETLKEQAEQVIAASLEALRNAKGPLVKAIPALEELHVSETQETDRQVFNKLIAYEEAHWDEHLTDVLFDAECLNPSVLTMNFSPLKLELVMKELERYEANVDQIVEKGAQTLKLLREDQIRFDKANEELKSKLRNANQVIDLLDKRDQLINSFQLKMMVENITESHTRLNAKEENISFFEQLKHFFSPSNLADPIKRWLKVRLPFLPIKSENLKMTELGQYTKVIRQWIRQLETTSLTLQRQPLQTLPQQLQMVGVNNEELETALRKRYEKRVELIADELLDPVTGKIAAAQYLVERDLAEYIPEGSLATDIITSLNVKKNEIEDLKTEFNPHPFNWTDLRTYPHYFSSRKKALDELSPADLVRHESLLTKKVSEAIPSVMKQFPINLMEEQRNAFHSASQKGYRVADLARLGGQRFVAFEIEAKIKAVKFQLDSAWGGKVKDLEAIKDSTKAMKKSAAEIDKFISDRKDIQHSAFEQLVCFQQMGFKVIDNQDLAELRQEVIDDVKARVDDYYSKLTKMEEAVNLLTERFALPFNLFEPAQRLIKHKIQELEGYKEKIPVKGWFMTTNKDWESLNVDQIVQSNPIHRIDDEAIAGIKAVYENPLVGPFVEHLISYNKEIEAAKTAFEKLNDEKQFVYAIELKRVVEEEETKIKARESLRYDSPYHDSYGPTLNTTGQKNFLDLLKGSAQTLSTCTNQFSNSVKLSPEDQLAILSTMRGYDPVAVSLAMQELQKDVVKNVRQNCEKTLETYNNYKDIIKNAVKSLGLPLSWEKELNASLKTLQEVQVTEKTWKGLGADKVQTLDLRKISELLIGPLAVHNLNNSSMLLNRFSSQLHQFATTYSLNELKDVTETVDKTIAELKKNEESYGIKFQNDISDALKLTLKNLQLNIAAEMARGLQRAFGPGFPAEMAACIQKLRDYSLRAQTEMQKTLIDKRKLLPLSSMVQPVQDGTVKFLKVRQVVINECKEKLKNDLVRFEDYEKLRTQINAALLKLDKKMPFSIQWNAVLDQNINKAKQKLNALEQGFQPAGMAAYSKLGDLNKASLLEYIEEVENLTSEKIGTQTNPLCLVEEFENTTHLKQLAENLKKLNESVEQVEKAIYFQVSPALSAFIQDIKGVINHDKNYIAKQLNEIKHTGDVTGVIGDISEITKQMQRILVQWEQSIAKMRAGQPLPVITAADMYKAFSIARLNLLHNSTLQNMAWLNATATTLRTNVSDVVGEVANKQQEITLALTQAPTAKETKDLKHLSQTLDNNLKLLINVSKYPNQPQVFATVDDIEKYAMECRNATHLIWEQYHSFCKKALKRFNLTPFASLQVWDITDILKALAVPPPPPQQPPQPPQQPPQPPQQPPQQPQQPPQPQQPQQPPQPQQPQQPQSPQPQQAAQQPQQPPQQQQPQQPQLSTPILAHWPITSTTSIPAFTTPTAPTTTATMTTSSTERIILSPLTNQLETLKKEHTEACQKLQDSMLTGLKADVITSFEIINNPLPQFKDLNFQALNDPPNLFTWENATDIFDEIKKDGIRPHAEEVVVYTVESLFNGNIKPSINGKSPKTAWGSELERFENAKKGFNSLNKITNQKTISALHEGNFYPSRIVLKDLINELNVNASHIEYLDIVCKPSGGDKKVHQLLVAMPKFGTNSQDTNLNSDELLQVQFLFAVTAYRAQFARVIELAKKAHEEFNQQFPNVEERNQKTPPSLIFKTTAIGINDSGNDKSVIALAFSYVARECKTELIYNDIKVRFQVYGTNDNAKSVVDLFQFSKAQ